MLLRVNINDDISSEMNSDCMLEKVMDSYAMIVTVDGYPIMQEVWDTAGQEDFHGIRSMSYDDSDVFLICYSCDNLNSFVNVELLWMKGMV
mmetsp:Transcript_8464/g.10697  ORF Transcript_8464/g.10697 Transcript_8464/m.10697 type:complete len:91 (-) Transcript_8464:1524-1796(-)